MQQHDEPINESTPTSDVKSDGRSEKKVPYRERLLNAARSHVGESQMGDPVPFWLSKIMTGADAIIATPLLAYKDFISDASSLGLLVDATTPELGDIGILQYGYSDAYWSFIVSDVFEHEIEIIVSQSFNPYVETEVRKLRMGWPNYNDSWHIAGLIRI